MKIDLMLEHRKRWPGQAERKRRKVQVTLSDEARAILDRQPNKSAFVEKLIINSERE